MYSREMGGIRSDGQLYSMGYGEEEHHEMPAPPPQPPPPCPPPAPAPKKGFLNLSFLQDLKLEDLLLLAIGFLLLTGEGDGNNDLLILLIGLLLLL
jgi:hypothetical protein